MKRVPLKARGGVGLLDEHLSTFLDRLIGLQADLGARRCPGNLRVIHLHLPLAHGLIEISSVALELVGVPARQGLIKLQAGHTDFPIIMGDGADFFHTSSVYTTISPFVHGTSHGPRVTPYRSRGCRSGSWLPRNGPASL